MSNVGWVGLGKLGLPCALALDAAGHTVCGTDVNPAVHGYLTDRTVPYREEGVAALLAEHEVEWMDTVAQVVALSDVIFVAVQTPHAPAFEGAAPLTEAPRDFEYGYLTAAVREVCAEADRQHRHVTVVVVSTVLPGTFNRWLRPLTNRHARLVYNPFFIAMGTTVADFTHPEFVLVGTDDGIVSEPLDEVYAKLHERPLVATSIETAELTKVAYNTFIGLKVAFANTMMEVCHHTGADCDDLTAALSMATDRVISPAYLRGGMGDGGGCHPRDNIAMSWLAERLGLSFDLFGTVMAAREAQSRWLADLACEWADLTGLPIVLCGEAYKPGSNLTVGSPARLLAAQLDERRPAIVDPHTGRDDDRVPFDPAVFVITTAHPEWPERDWPARSVVVDPHGYIGDAPGVTVIRLGRKGPL